MKTKIKEALKTKFEGVEDSILISLQLCSIYRVTLGSFQNEIQNDSPYLVRYGQFESVIGIDANSQWGVVA